MKKSLNIMTASLTTADSSHYLTPLLWWGLESHLAKTNPSLFAVSEHSRRSGGSFNCRLRRSGKKKNNKKTERTKVDSFLEGRLLIMMCCNCRSSGPSNYNSKVEVGRYSRRVLKITDNIKCRVATSVIGSDRIRFARRGSWDWNWIWSHDVKL